jgi:hypothetical protein
MCHGQQLMRTCVTECATGSNSYAQCCRAGRLTQLRSNELKEKFKNPKDYAEIEELADCFVQGIRDNNYEAKGYSSSMYGISKACETSYTLWLARQLKGKVCARLL